MYQHSPSNPSLLDQKCWDLMNLRNRMKANANSTFTHILALIHTLYILVLHRPIGTPHPHRHTIFRVVIPQDWRFLWILAACLICFHGMTEMYYSKQQCKQSAEGRFILKAEHMCMLIFKLRQCLICFWCSVASQDIIV